MNLILFRYILKNFALIFFATLFSLAAIVMLFDMVELLRIASKRENIAFLDILALAFLKSPQMMHIILPFIVLLSGIIFFLKKSATLELTVMRAIGFSVWNFMVPVLTFVAIIGVIDVTVFSPFSALTAKRYERLEERIGLTRSHPFSWTEKGLWLRDTQDGQTLVLRASRVRQEKKDVMLDNLSIFELNNQGHLIRQIEAENGLLHQNMLTLPNAFIIDPIIEDSYIKQVESLKTNISLERILERFDEPRTMSFWRFPRFIRFLKESGFTTNEHQMYFHELIAYPITLIAMIFIAAVFALPPTMRQGRILLRIVLAVLAGFLLYFLGRVTNVLGLSQNLPYFLAAWGPALISIPLCVSALLHLEDG